MASLKSRPLPREERINLHSPLVVSFEIISPIYRYIFINDSDINRRAAFKALRKLKGFRGSPTYETYLSRYTFFSGADKLDLIDASAVKDAYDHLLKTLVMLYHTAIDARVYLGIDPKGKYLRVNTTKLYGSRPHYFPYFETYTILESHIKKNGGKTHGH